MTTARLMAPEKPLSKMSGTPPPKEEIGGSGSRIGFICFGLNQSPIIEKLSEGIELDVMVM
jgi:hypothetical protein